MPSARLLLVLVCATAACFSDTVPAGLSTTAASTAGETSTTDATTGGGSTTTAATTTGATGQPATTSTSTATTGDASTTGTTGTTGDVGTTGPATTTTDTTTGAGVEYPECAAFDNQFECTRCCRNAEPGAEKYFVDLEQCVCAEDHACFSDCSESVCFDDWLADICYACIAPLLGDPCFQMVADTCAQEPTCKPYLECLVDAGCALKPAVLPGP